ncbi:hypothetical protein CASFOL_036023 [Castilleja foliolosa]|uniref:Uncharacterized protein n=1 Tax=Castilleja foliolosa TaxID=1961234 RepID=A0ABD3BUE1_9LAMI
MQTITFFIFDIFQQYSYARGGFRGCVLDPPLSYAERKNVEIVKLFIQQFNGGEAYTYGEELHVSALYLEGYQGDLKWEFTSLIHHEMTHVFQWDGEGKAPVGLREGVADYMILKSSFYPPGYAKRGQGERWDQGYDFTARFLEYCDMLRPGFVAELNKMMRYDYSDSYFQVLLGKSVEQFWTDYKAMYPYHS